MFGPYLFKSLACRNKVNEYLVVILFKAPYFMMVLGHGCLKVDVYTCSGLTVPEPTEGDVGIFFILSLTIFKEKDQGFVFKILLCHRFNSCTVLLNLRLALTDTGCLILMQRALVYCSSLLSPLGGSSTPLA